MTITDIRAQRLDLRLSDPEWRFVRGPIVSIEGYVVEVADDRGRVGHGYFRAMPPATPPLAALKASFDPLAAALVGADERAINANLDRLDQLVEGQAPLKAGIECALLDLLGRSLGVPLHELYGGRRHETLANARIVPLKSPDAMAAVAAQLAGRGFAFLKIKLSGDAALDLARVQAVRAAVGPAVRLMADANQSYAPKAAIRLICKIAEVGVELIEQPTPGWDLAGLAEVTRAVPIPVEADEAAPDLHAIQRIIERRAADSISLRVMNLGGITQTRRAVALCESAGMAYRFGAIFGSSVMHAHTLHLAASLPAPVFAHEFSEFELFLADRFGGLHLERGAVRVPIGPGTGMAAQPEPGRS